jgi:quercetin dioxygenase-like cupin family protein
VDDVLRVSALQIEGFREKHLTCRLGIHRIPLVLVPIKKVEVYLYIQLSSDVVAVNVMADMEVKSFKKPDKVMKFEKGKVELVEIAGKQIGKHTFEPGWKWSKHVKPIAKTESCKASHFVYIVSGTLHVTIDGGTEMEAKAGDIMSIPPGHDAWVVGKETVIAVDFQGLT